MGSNDEQPSEVDAHHHVWTLIAAIFIEAALGVAVSTPAEVINPVAAIVATIALLVAVLKTRHNRLEHARQVPGPVIDKEYTL